VTYAESGLFWSQCFLPSLVIRKAQAGAGKSSLGLLWCKCTLAWPRPGNLGPSGKVAQISWSSGGRSAWSSGLVAVEVDTTKI
jgi:hypothetical protein